MKFKAGEIAPAMSKSLNEIANEGKELSKDGEEIFNLECLVPHKPPTEMPRQQIEPK